jgi:hypothetical protein
VQRVVYVIVGLLAAVALFVGLHPVSPARTFDAYKNKAKDTAESARSSVQTARLAARLATRGDLYGPYTSVVLSEAESALGGATATFDSIQPPDHHSDQVRSELDTLLARSSDVVSRLRISARRGEIGTLDREAKPLDRVARDLDAFIKAYG